MAHSLACEEPCWLLDKIPPEVRLMIFRLALRTPHGFAKRPDVIEDRPNGTNAIINTSLFLIGRLASEEARDAFYLEHTVRLNDSVRTVYGNKHIRKIEIAGNIATLFCHGRWALGQKIEALARLPKLQSITLVCDSLHKREITVRDFITRALPNSELHCRAIGLFEVSLPSVGLTKVYLQKNLLTRVLPGARKLAAQHGLATLGNLDHDELDRDSKNKHLLAVWLKYHGVSTLKIRDSVTFEEITHPIDAEAHLLMGVGMEKFFATCAQPWVHPQFPNDVRIGDLTVEEHGAELVEWASDLMAA